ncbi:hypothetical protein [Microbispora sp. H10949]|uniref:hypothetical protein n=1 Tax=Microbispora sp. H10949 TaxID=2729111 RepID=UPI00160105C0|nr:hypothetical protein [Microbispora sp. H10949]
MTIRHIFRAIFRHPLVVLFVIVAIGGPGFYVTELAPASYQAHSVVSVVRQGEETKFTSSTIGTAELLAASFDDDRSRDEVARAGGRADYRVVMDNQGSEEVPTHDQPYIVVDTFAPAAAEAEKAMTVLVRAMRVRLASWQMSAGADDDYYLLRLKNVASTRKAVEVPRHTKQAAAVLALLVVMVVVKSAVVADRVLASRRSWLRLRRAPAAAPPPRAPVPSR